MEGIVGGIFGKLTNKPLKKSNHIFKVKPYDTWEVEGIEGGIFGKLINKPLKKIQS